MNRAPAGALAHRAADGVAPIQFFGLTFALSAPFWALGAVVGRSGALPMRLPASSLMVVAPILAASILTYRAFGGAGVRRLLGRSVDPSGIGASWLVPTLVTIPSIYVASYAVMRLAGRPMPDPTFSPIDIAILAGVFFAAAAGEEVGWMGVGIGPLRDRWGALRASLALGGIWVVWHLPGFVQYGLTPAAVVWQSVFTVAARVLIVWLSEHTGRSLLAPILFHVTINLGVALFPNGGATYDAAISGPITAAVAATVAVLGFRTPARSTSSGPQPA
jgi:membrane protease YdiL (CAAX protease family)